MNKLTWSYDKASKAWHSKLISLPIRIDRSKAGLRLLYFGTKFIGHFFQLKNAKEVARLLAFG